MTKPEILDTIEQELIRRLKGMAMAPQVWNNEGMYYLLSNLMMMEKLKKQ